MEYFYKTNKKVINLQTCMSCMSGMCTTQCVDLKNEHEMSKHKTNNKTMVNWCGLKLKLYSKFTYDPFLCNGNGFVF